MGTFISFPSFLMDTRTRPQPITVTASTCTCNRLPSHTVKQCLLFHSIQPRPFADAVTDATHFSKRGMDYHSQMYEKYQLKK